MGSLSPLLLVLAQAGATPLGTPGTDRDPMAESPFVASRPVADGTLSWGLLLRAFFTSAPEEAAAAGAEDAISGFVFEDVDLFASYAGTDVSARISADLDGLDDAEPELSLEDAYARWQYARSFGVAVGQLKPRVVRSASVPASELLFRERTFLGAVFDAWDRGVEVGGEWDEFFYWLAVMDGANGSTADHFVSARGVWALVDDLAGDREGARGAPNHLRVALGASVFKDYGVSTSDGGGFAADLALTLGPYAFHGEWAKLDDEFLRAVDVFDGQLLTIGDGHPYSATFSRRVGDEAELALRYEDADEADATQAFGVALGWAPGAGPVRLVADYRAVEGDTQDFGLFSLGVSVGSSGIGLPFGDPPR